MKHDGMIDEEVAILKRWAGIVISMNRARNWGLVCGFGYGFAAATFAFMILLFATAP